MYAIFQNNIKTIKNNELYNLMQQAADSLIKYNPGNHILTDDKAPVELLGIQVIDGLIKEEAAYYKEIFKKDGIKGLLNSFH